MQRKVTADERSTRRAGGWPLTWLVVAGVFLSFLVGGVLYGLRPGMLEILPGAVELRIFRAASPPPEYPQADWVPDPRSLMEAEEPVILAWNRVSLTNGAYGYTSLNVTIASQSSALWLETRGRSRKSWAVAYLHVGDQRELAGVVNLGRCDDMSLQVTPAANGERGMMERGMELRGMTRRLASEAGVIRRWMQGR